MRLTSESTKSEIQQTQLRAQTYGRRGHTDDADIWMDRSVVQVMKTYVPDLFRFWMS